jgi:outer membrane protein insertion porin family
VSRLTHLVLCALSALALLAAVPARAQAPVISDVKVEGNRRVEVDAIKAALTQKKGQEFDARKVRADVKALMKLGYFTDVVVEVEGDVAKPVLVYRVAERPTVREVKIEGNAELSKDDLKDTVELKVLTMLDPARVRKDVKAIQEKYVEKGYYLAEVKPEIEALPDNQVNVVYRVDERAKVQVRQIRFVGAEKVSPDDLRAYMGTKEGGLLSVIGSLGTFKQEVFERDLQAIQAVYLDRGFVNVKVDRPSVQLSPDRRFIYVTIPVEEGEQFDIGRIAFSGELLGEEARLAGLVKTKPGERFMRSKIGQDLFAVGDVFRDRGYAYVNVTPVTDVDTAKRTVDITFDVAPGEKVRFERIEIVGNDRTRDKVIRRELRVDEGALYSGTGLKKSKERVNALGYFETVEITTRRGSAEDLVVATVEVKERATGTFQIGAGFSSYENFILTGQISQNNFFGWGQTLSLQVQWSSVRQLGQIQFLEPYFLDTKWTFAFDVYATEGVFTTFNRRAVGGSMTWGYELSGLEDVWAFARHLEDVRLFGTYTNEYVSVTQGTADVILKDRFRSGTTSAFRLALTADRRDNRLFPTKGWYLSGSAEVAPPFLAPEAVFGSRVNLFSRYALDARTYRPVLWGIVFRTKLSLGYIRDWDAEHRVPISELFYVGGINSVRGYRFQSIAPQDLVPGSNDPVFTPVAITVGGDKQLVANLELEFPLFDKIGIRGVAFFDAGNAFPRGSWGDGDPVNSPSLGLYKSYGFGFRWTSPIGPLRFEWGIPLDRRRNFAGQVIDQAVDFQFTIGNFF